MYLKIVEALENFDRATRKHAWRGGGHPADVPLIEKEYVHTKTTLLYLIRKALKIGEK